MNKFESVFASTKECFASVLNTPDKKKPWEKFGDWFSNELQVLKSANKLDDMKLLAAFYKDVSELLLEDDSSTIEADQHPIAPVVSLFASVPVVTTNELWVTYVISGNSSDDTKPVSDPNLAKLIDNKKVFWRVQSVGDKEITRRKLGGIVAAGVPVVVLQNSSGKIIKTVKTNDPVAIISLIRSNIK